MQGLAADPVSNLASASVSASAPVQQAATMAMGQPEELDPSGALWQQGESWAGRARVLIRG